MTALGWHLYTVVRWVDFLLLQVLLGAIHLQNRDTLARLRGVR